MIFIQDVSLTKLRISSPIIKNMRQTKKYKGVVMVKFILTTLILILQGNAFANSNIQNILKKIMLTDGKTGAPESNSENQNSDLCNVKIYENADSVELHIEDTGYYFSPISYAFYSNIELIDQNTILVSTNSNRPGGDACGDAGGAFGYKEYITVTDSKIEIRKTYRCAYELFKKHDIYTRCSFKK